MKLFIGLDVSSTKLDTCFLTSESTVLLEMSVSNDLTGAYEIKARVLDYLKQFDFTRIVIGLEATGQYSSLPALFFHEDEELRSFGVETTVENPRNVHRFMKVFTEDKNDRLDAFHIADYLRLERFHTSPIKEEQYIALQSLTRARFDLIQDMTRTKQHFLNILYMKCNVLQRELKSDSGSTSVFSSTIIELFTTDYTLDEIGYMPLEELVDLLQEKGRGRFREPENLAKRLQKAVRNSYRLSKTVQDSIDSVLASQVRIIRTYQDEIKALDKAIVDILEIIPESKSLLSIPGIGPVYTAGILAEVGQIDRFADQAKFAKYAGLYWPKSQSGQFKKESTPLSKQGNRYLRYYLIEATNSVRRHVPEYSDYYQKKYKEVPKHQHKRALALTARKFVRLVDKLLRDHQLYTPPRRDIEHS
ncbi:IS110 family transposase [Alkalibacterium olivapovliticus]|uniref:Transposase IS116/IS110/IS902 family protein n=1 Tax=Alkalibacterium olivapovliticus TaxID=99907 RepID=A0A2T0VNM9_9LACT|nr:IS110 family transposase [Alkalibacterium olivapovliticus]PRY71859.1 transposase IS116/IS110/IS902 family protein [Alkalibacterium olivapovliticus]